MKRYLVLRTYKYSSPDVAFATDDLERARMWAKVMSEEDNREYIVIPTEYSESYKPEEE